MTQSMTAFARADLQTELGSYSWEIRSVNSRYLEPHFRLHDTLKHLEGPVREQIRKHLNRGKIECSLKFTPLQVQQDFNVNESTVRKISHAADQVHAIIGPGNALSAMQILQWPGVLDQPALNAEIAGTEALQAFSSALKELIDMRGREGAALKIFIQQRLDAIAIEVDKVKAVLPEILQAQKENLEKKCAAFQANLDPDRLEQEMVIVLQKADVAEELDRLVAHLAEVQRILNQKGPVGRRLDFMMQELNREANTLSSKSLSHLTTQSAVELKVLIEQMREQIQNIE